MDWAWLKFRQKEIVLHVRLIEHYISAKFQTCTIILTDSLKIKENFAKNAFFRP